MTFRGLFDVSIPSSISLSMTSRSPVLQISSSSHLMVLCTYSDIRLCLFLALDKSLVQESLVSHLANRKQSNGPQIAIRIQFRDQKEDLADLLTVRVHTDVIADSYKLQAVGVKKTWPVFKFPHVNRGELIGCAGYQIRKDEATDDPRRSCRHGFVLRDDSSCPWVGTSDFFRQLSIFKSSQGGELKRLTHKARR